MTRDDRVTDCTPKDGLHCRNIEKRFIARETFYPDSRSSSHINANCCHFNFNILASYSDDIFYDNNDNNIIIIIMTLYRKMHFIYSYIILWYNELNWAKLIRKVLVIRILRDLYTVPYLFLFNKLRFPFVQANSGKVSGRKRICD